MPQDKAEYQERRARGLRGQGDPPKRKFYPKGAPVLKRGPNDDPIMRYEHGKLVDATLPNDEGHHAVSIKGKLTYLNRNESRRRQVSRLFTKRGFKPDVGEPHFTHPGKQPSNHQRMLIRKVEREQRIVA